MSNLPYFPVILDLAKFRILVIGGGKVGSKRAIKFHNYNANVTVVSENFSEDLLNSPIEKIEMSAENLSEDFLRKFEIIITATNNKELNSKLCDMAKNLGKLCNNPTNPEDSNFIVPIFYSDNSYEIAVTTYGKSSLVSEFILNEILDYLSERKDFVNMLTNAMAKVKEIAKEKINDPSIRFTLYYKIFYDKLFSNFLINKKYDEAISRAEEIINEYTK
ncbi:bifunctional precorrin-2 dehydrogenase/sirohydrochlorin ferrochelatase [Acidianus sp. HS-5]|uniref:precorrin-2 dehydrogenase/sirohydrochlorin ferrochelatase family protein n=1 Tax=Acidianus sp. HS-5 TaxID=2886040 RepID=UPI001F314763|nr:bifunctional precorrin-2 dehydrogenase/sirohydrochlorin ferrochelatase [Acidianus sp. HS-5]BDC19086.1 siroheme synthase [Acidianus sp. HS-5]